MLASSIYEHDKYVNKEFLKHSFELIRASPAASALSNYQIEQVFRVVYGGGV